MSESEHRERKSRSGPSSGSFKIARVQVQELAALAGSHMAVAPGADLLSDELLVDRTLRGEPGHYAVLMRRNAARLYRIARGMLGSSTRAEEIVQASFVRAYENLSTYDRRLRFGDWLGRIAIHGALASLKRASEPPAAPKAPRRQLDLARQLEDAVDSLPERCRIAFTLCVLDGMPPTQVAETLGLSLWDLQLAAFRGRLRVRRQLAMRFDDAEARAFGLDLSSAEAIFTRVQQRLEPRAP